MIDVVLLYHESFTTDVYDRTTNGAPMKYPSVSSDYEDWSDRAQIFVSAIQCLRMQCDHCIVMNDKRNVDLLRKIEGHLSQATSCDTF